MHRVLRLAVSLAAASAISAPVRAQTSDVSEEAPGDRSPGSGESDHRLGEIVVTGARTEIPLKESPSATSVVDQDALSAMPRAVGAEEALRLVPGVKVDNQADGERVHLSIRGIGLLTERGIRGIKVLVDGIPLNDPTGFAPDLFDIDWSNVERIEVLRGPASALYGGASAGGIINIITKDGAEDAIGGDGSLTTGAYDFWKGHVGAGGTSGSVNYHVAASRSYGNGYRTHTAFNATNGYAKARWNIDDRIRLTAVAAGTDFFNENAEGLNRAWLAADRRQANPDALTYNEYQRTRRVTAGLVGRVGLDDQQDVTFGLHYRHTLWRESVPSSLQYRTYRTPGGTVQYNLHLPFGWVQNHLSVGVDFGYQSILDHSRANLGGASAGPDLLSKETISQTGVGALLFDRVGLRGSQWVS